MAGNLFKKIVGLICDAAERILKNNLNQGTKRVLDNMLGKDHPDSDLKNMKNNFRTLMARVDDLEKDISVKVEQGGGKRKREVEVWFEDVEKVKEEYRVFVEQEEEEGEGFLKMVLGGDEAKQLIDRIRDLDNRSQLFGELVLADRTTVGVPRLTSILKMEGDAFWDNFERIWNLLENDQVSSIGVHGMGGVGKSTLVEHIHNKLIENRKCVFWVIVSDGCSIKMLQDKIARKLRLDLSDEDDDDVGARAARLNYALSRRKKFILILDDVWERINLMKVGVPLSMEGCKWIMTSRSLNVCQQMNCQETIVINPLSKDEGWNLFLTNLGQAATSALRDPEVEEIAKHVAGICDGLPLGIITVAGAMSGVTEVHEWRHELRVLNEMGHEFMEEEVFRVLEYSFNRLNSNDQLCFLCCSVYPEDYSIPKSQLFRNFISEKLVDEKKSLAGQYDEAHSIVTRLVKVSLLENDDEHWVKMHDLVRAMAHKITNGKTMVIVGQDTRRKIPGEEEWTKDLEKVSLMMNSISEIPDGMSPNCPKLTTLTLQQNPLREGITTSFFSQMCGLITLDLSFTEIKELPDSVSDLVNLKSLLLEKCYKLRKVPSVRKLKELRELDLTDTSIEDVPQGMEELVNIRYLSMNGAEKLRRTSLELRLPKIVFLSVPWHIQAELVEGWESLEVFTGRLKHMSDFSRLFANQKDDVSYSIVVGDTNLKFDRQEDIFGGRRELCVCGYSLTSILEADYIHHLRLDSCEGMSKCLLDDLSNPASLEKLKIKECGGTEWLLTYEQFKAPQQHLKSGFEALKEVVLEDLEEFTGVIHKLEIEAAASLPPPSVFSSLRWLTISRCNKMKNLGLPLSIIQKLVGISIEECEEIEEIIQVPAARGDMKLVLCSAVEDLEVWIPVRCRHKIEKTSLAPDPPTSSLRRLTISGCNKMKKLGLPLSAFETLEEISIRRCEDIEEIIQVAALGPISLPNLEKLHLIGLPSLKSFSSVPLIYNASERFIEECPRLEDLFLN